MTTALDVIQAAYEEIGVYGPGDTIAASDSARGLLLLNEMIGAWVEEYLPIYSLTGLSITLVNTQAQYTIGTTGSPSLNVQRPVRIDYGPASAIVTVSGVSTPANIVSEVEWNNIFAISPGSGTPTTVFYDPQYPLGVINVAPTPNAAGTLSLNGWYGFNGFFASPGTPSLSAAFNFDASTVDALKHNLALIAKPFFTEAQPNPATVTRALETKAALRRTNITSRAMMKRASPLQRAAQGAHSA